MKRGDLSDPNLPLRTLRIRAAVLRTLLERPDAGPSLEPMEVGDLEDAVWTALAETDVDSLSGKEVGQAARHFAVVTSSEPVLGWGNADGRRPARFWVPLETLDAAWEVLQGYWKRIEDEEREEVADDPPFADRGVPPSGVPDVDYVARQGTPGLDMQNGRRGKEKLGDVDADLAQFEWKAPTKAQRLERARVKLAVLKEDREYDGESVNDFVEALEDASDAEFFGFLREVDASLSFCRLLPLERANVLYRVVSDAARRVVLKARIYDPGVSK